MSMTTTKDTTQRTTSQWKLFARDATTPANDTVRLLLPLKKRGNQHITVIGDLFHKDVPFEFIDKVFAVMALCPQHTFQILTKRPERMEEYFMRYDHAYFSNMVFANALRHIAPEQAERYRNASIAVQFPLPNVWLGTSVENQEAADARIPHLLKCPAAVRFLSVEPQIVAIRGEVKE